MRTFTQELLTALALTVLAATSAEAARPKDTAGPPPRLFGLDRAPRQPKAGPLAVPGAVEEFLIQVSPAAVAANPPAFTIDLPTLPPLEALRTRFVVYRPDWKSWSGTLRPAGSSDEGTGYIHLGYHGEQLTAVIEYQGERYRIVGGLWESHRLARLSDDLSPRSCALDTLDDPGADALLSEAMSEPTFTANATTRLDVLAVYPKAYFAYGPAAEAGVFNFIEDSISIANDVFFNSSVDASYNLVGIVPITGTQPPSSGLYEAIIWLNGQPTEVANLRNAFGADIVTIYIPFIWSSNDICGIANLPRNNNTFISAVSATQFGVVSAAMGSRAFTANRDGCGLGDLTLGHEIGHNYGMRHDDAINTSVDLEPNGRGFLQPGQWATAMGCYCTGCACNRSCSLGSGAVCNRIPYFSDPNKTYNGVTIGAADRNNAQVARNRVASYAAFKTQSTNTPPTANFTVSCTGRTCTYNASSSTDNTTIPTTGYWWDFGDGTTGTGKIVNHTYSFGTFFWVHLVVTDSGGQKDVTLNSASPI